LSLYDGPVADIPSIAGFTFRAIDPGADIDALVDVFNRSSEADGSETAMTVEQMASDYRHSDHCDFPDDTLLAERDGKVVGYSRSLWDQEIGGPRVFAVFAFIRPEFRKELTKALLGWAEERGRERFVKSGASEAVFDAWVGGEPEETLLFLREKGYARHTRNSDMVRSDLDNVSSVVLPDGVKIRPVEESHFRAIWDAGFEAFDEHEGAVEETPEMFERFLANPKRCEELWRVGWHRDQVVGQVRTFVNDDENLRFERLRGYTEDISTVRPWRQQGIATALINASLRDLRNRGYTEAALEVHLANKDKALDLYLALGYELSFSWTGYRRPIEGP